MKKVLITGGTGSFGKAFIKNILNNFPEVERLVIFSRDELKQFELNNELDGDNDPRLRFFLGDVRDYSRLNRALEDIDTVIHAAALKQVPAAEYNPFEFIKTNVIGAQNLIEACWSNNVQNVVALSTDKAAAPVNLYGATKLCSDKLFVAANLSGGSKPTKFSVVRYGNVMGSRGSVIPFFIDRKDNETLPITDEAMTRFNITLSEGVDMVLWAIRNSNGGEIFVPKIPSYRIIDVARAVSKNASFEIIGRRPGEKIHEEMITSSDSYSTVDLGRYYAILPSGDNFLEKYCEKKQAIKVPTGFSYNSGDNSEFLSIDEIKNLISSEL